MPLLRDENASWRSHLHGNCSQLYGSFDGRWRYQWDGVNGEELLFDQVEDRKDLHDRSDDPALAEIKASLRASMAQWMAANGDIRIDESGNLRTVPIRTVGSDSGNLGFKTGPWNNRGWR